MPNRLIRDWTDSDTISKLSAEGERFFTRLLMKADDFGYYYADPKRLRTTLFPLTVDDVSIDDIKKWMQECLNAQNTQTGTSLIMKFENKSNEYVFVPFFKQRLRNKVRKFPRMENEERYLDEDSIEIESTVFSGNILDSAISELANSSILVRIAIDLGIDKEALIKKIPEFKKSCKTSYTNAHELYGHFKNWANKNRSLDSGEAGKSTSNFSKYKKR